MIYGILMAIIVVSLQGKEGEFVFVDFTENASKDWLEEELRRVDGRLAMTGLWLVSNSGEAYYYSADI